jgi:hypothetical protein
MARVVMAYTFSDVNSGEEIVAKVAGQGLDTGDKAPCKAMTGALKYALLQSFLLATGDDPEDERVDARFTAPGVDSPISSDQVRELEKLIGDTGTDLERVLAYYKVAALAEMTEIVYQRALEVLNRKLANHRQRETGSPERIPSVPRRAARASPRIRGASRLRALHRHPDGAAESIPRIERLKQNTPEWHRWRLQGLGASDAPVVMGDAPFQDAAVSLVKTCLVHDGLEWMRASLDGLSFDGSIALEIKWPWGNRDQAALRTGRIPAHYYAQVPSIAARHA